MRSIYAGIGAGLLLTCGIGRAQMPSLATVSSNFVSSSAGVAAGEELPDAPQAAPAQTASPAAASQTDSAAKPAKKTPEPIAGDALYAPLAVGADTLTVKTQTYVVRTFGPRAFFTPLISAGRVMVRSPHGYPDDWTVGPAAFGRNYGAALGTRTASNTARFGVGALLHEDFRYVPSTDTGVDRLFHAIGFTFVDRGDSGNRRLAVANFAGAAAGGFVPNAYLPDGFNTPGDGARRFASHMEGIAIQNTFREFSPEIFKLVQKLHIPFPRVPLREWWTNGWPN